MATVIPLLALQPVAAGVRNFGPVAVPVGVTSFIAVFDRTQMLSPTLRAKIAAELSLDGGATWMGAGGTTSDGGVILSPKTGLPETEFGFGVELPEPGNPNRRLRATTDLNEPTTTAVTITTFP